MIETIDVAGRTAWFARPDGSPRGAVVVCHGGGGLAPHEREVIERLAALGYAALAPDLYGVKPSVEIVKALVAEPSELRARVSSAVAWIRANAGPRELTGSRNDTSARETAGTRVEPGTREDTSARETAGTRAEPGTREDTSARDITRTRVAVIGHCFGGTAALECARSGADIACAVAFHGGLGTASPAERIAARVLACCGADDPFCPREQRTAFEDEMTRAGADWQLHVYGGAKHGFTVRGIERPGCTYDELADHRSWAAMIELLDETIGT